VKIAQEFDLMSILAEMDVNLAEMNRVRSEGERFVDLEVSARWVTPIHLIALAAMSSYLGIQIKCRVLKKRTSDYLNRIRFPSGTRDFISSGTAIPLTKLESYRDDDILGEYEERVLREVDPRYRANFRINLKRILINLVSGCQCI